MKIQTITYSDAKQCFEFSTDSGHALYISYDVYMKLNLHAPFEATASQEEILREEDQRMRAQMLGFRYAMYQPRTEGQVRQRLKRERIDDAMIQQTLEKLRRQHLLDDLAYAKRFASEKTSLRHWSKRKIFAQLQSKGVPIDTIKLAMQDVTGEQEEEALREVIERKYSRRNLSDEKEFQRTMQALLRQGFPLQAALRALKKQREKQA